MPAPVIALLLLLLTGLLLRLRAPSLARKLTPWLVLAALAVPLCEFAASLLWSSFMLYDDEGYVLHSLKDFLDGGSLYDRVYTQYGPFYFLFWKLGALTGLRPEHLHGRALTLLLWLACSGSCAFLAWRLSRLWFAAAAALAGSCIFLWPMANEPSHPGSLVCLLGISAALLVSGSKPPSRLLWSLAGLLTACLLLTKINTGLLLLVALCTCHAFACAYSNPGYRWARWLCLAVLALLPWLLMRPLLGQTAYLLFAAISCASLLACVLALPPRSTKPPALAPAPTLGRLIPTTLLLSFAAGILLILLFCLSSGTSLRGLLEGVLLAPLRFPNAFTTPINWRPGALLAAIAAPLLCLLIPHLSPSPRRLLLSLMVGLAALLFFLCWAECVPLNMQAFLMSYGLGMTWLFCLPIENTDSTAPARQAVALVLLLQALQAFPVGGSQISWGCVLWIPLCCARATQLFTELPRIIPRLSPGNLRLLGATLLLLLLGGSLRHAHLASQRLASGTRLEAPGAKSLRLPAELASAIQILCTNARLHGDLLFSMPGTYSFNLWTGLPTPSSDNATLWFRLLDVPAQTRIQTALAAHPRAVLIRENGTLDYLRARHISIEGPLVSYIDREFTEIFSLGSHSFLIHKDRKIAPLGILSRQGAGREPNTEILETLIPSQSLHPGFRLELHQLTQDTSRCIFTSSGQLKLISDELASPAIRRLRLQIPSIPPSFPVSDFLLKILAPDGSLAAVARVPAPSRPQP